MKIKKSLVTTNEAHVFSCGFTIIHIIRNMAISMRSAGLSWVCYLCAVVRASMVWWVGLVFPKSSGNPNRPLISLCSFFRVSLCWVYQNHVFFSSFFAQINKTHWYSLKVKCQQWALRSLHGFRGPPSRIGVVSYQTCNIHQNMLQIAEFSSIQLFIIFKAEKGNTHWL